MLRREKRTIPIYFLSLIACTLCLTAVTLAQEATDNAQIIERYKQMLNRKPKEGSTFDRLYQFYLEGAGLEAMVADYQAAAESKPDAPNLQLILGHIYKRLGKETEAIKAYQRAVTLSPNNYYPHFALGHIYTTLRQYEQAIDTLTKAAALSEQTDSATSTDRTSIYKTLGRAYFHQDRIDEAIATWTKIAELEPQNIFARIELADLFHEQELYPQAIAQHEAIIEIKREDTYRVCLSLREIGKIHEDAGAYREAQARYDAALALTAPGNWLRRDLQQRIIGIYAADADWKGLIAYYQDKLAATPNDPERIGLQAAAYIENQQLAEGIAAYRKALALAPTDTELRLNLIAALRSAEQLEDAAVEYEVLSEQHPDNFGIYRELGKLYLALEDEDKAKSAYQRMIDQDPENASTHFTLAEIYTGHEWLEEAVAAYQKAISLAPDNLDYIEYFGEFYMRQGSREQAIETWNQIVAGEKGIAENYDRLAQLLDTKDFHTKALAASRKAVELMPDAYRYREALAKRLTQHKQYDAALAEYTEAVKLAPNEFFAEQMDDQRIELYRRQGTLVDQIAAMEVALEKPGIPDTDIFAKQKRLAKMYLKLENNTYALEVLLNAKTLRPDDVTVNRWLAEIYIKQGERDAANAVYTHLANIDRTNAREYYTNIARLHLNAMDLEAAKTAAKQIVAHSPRNPEGHQMFAEIAEQTEDYETATESLKQAIRLRPEAIDIRAKLADTYKISGRFQEAISQYWRCWELSDNLADKRTFLKPLSELYYGRHGEFEEKLKQLSKSNPSSVAPVLALSELYRTVGDLSSARFQLARALDRNREHPELLETLVKISFDLGDIAAALTYQQQLVKAHPGPDQQQKLGALLYDAGREQEAIQAWSKVLHTKNKPVEAEVKLATLLIEYGLIEEALFALDRAAEKATGPTSHIVLYQIGKILVEMNEFDRAKPIFQRILQMPKPPADSNARIVRTSGQNISSRNPQQRQPTSFDEAQTGALTQLKNIMEQEGQLDALIAQFETNAAANPKDMQTLELLAELYTLTNNFEKKREIAERLLAISPNNPAYQSMRLDLLATEPTFNYEILKKQFDAMPGLTPETRHRYTIGYARKFLYGAEAEDREKLLDELEAIDVTNLSNGPTLVRMLIDTGRTEAAEKVIAQLPTPTIGQLNQQYRFYEHLTTAYLREGHIDKAIALYWKFFERTKPRTTGIRRVAALSLSSYSYSGYRPIQTSYPAPTFYYNQNRLQALQQFFNQLWINNQQEALYTAFKAHLDTTQGRERIYPLLAMSYCYWWEGRRAEAQEILSALQQEFPNDLTLKLNTVFVSIQTGEFKTALALLKELTAADVKNRHQYYDLTLQLVLHTGDTVSVRELVTKILNSPRGVRELYQFSQKLQQSGLTQYAIAVAQRATTLAMRERDPNLLVQLSQHLNRLGRGQDAARLAARALQFGDHQMSQSRNMLRQAMRLAGSATSTEDREAKLVEAIERNPKSFQAHIRLASFYESRSQIQKASDAYDAALALRPTDSMTRKRYAEMLQHSGRAKDAVTQYVILLKEDANLLRPNYWQIIEIFFKAGEANTLIATVKEGLETTRQYSGRYYEIARAAADQCTRHNNPKGAIEIYEKMVEVNWHSAYQRLVSAYVAAGQREKAIQLLRGRLRTESLETQVQIVLRMAEFDETLDELKNLITEYEPKLTADKQEPALLYFVAILKVVTDDIEGADPLVSRLLEDVPSRMRLSWLNTLADAYRSKSDSQRQIRMLAAATQNVDPQLSWQLSSTYEKLGEAYMRTGEKEQAWNALRKMGALRLMRASSGSYWEKENITRKYMEHEMWDDAEVLFTEIINNPSVQQYQLERAQKALMTIKAKRDGLSETPELPTKRGNLNIGVQRAMAQQYMQRNQIGKAIEIYEQVAKMMPEDLESRSQLATLYSRQNQHDKAVEAWKALLEADPENTRYQDGLIDAYQQAGRVGDAIKLAEEYIEADSEVGVHYVRLAKLYAAAGQIDDAITHYKKAIELTSGDVRVYQQLGQLYLREDDLDAAEKAFQEALRYAAQDGGRHNIEQQLLDVYHRQGKLEEKLKEAEEKGTLTFQMLQQQARHYSNQGKLDEAVKAYKKALEMTTNDWERQNIERQLVRFYRNQGKLEEVLKAAEKNGTLTFTMQTELARHYRQAGESEKAIRAYKTALNMTSQDHERNRIASELMQEYARVGEDDLAIELYESVYRPDSSTTSTMYGASGLSVKFGGDEVRESLIQAYSPQRKLEELRTLFEKKLTENPNDPAILEMIAEIYRTENQHEKAAAAYQTLCTAQPSNVRAFYHAAAAFQKNRQPELAKKLLKQGERALSSNHKKGDMWLLMALGAICFESEMYTPAITFFKDAVVAVGTTYGGGGNWHLEILYEMLAKSYRATEQYEEAVKAYQQLANVARSSHRQEEAEAAIKQVYNEGNLHEKRIPQHLKKLEQNPDDTDTRLSLAESYVSSGKVEEAIAHYEKLAELQPDNVEWYKAIGSLYRKTWTPDKPERLAKVAAAYEKAITLEPTSYELYSRLADTYKKAAQLSKAEALYRQALAADLTPAEHDSAMTAIWQLYAGEKHADKRLAILEELNTEIDNSAVLYRLLGDTYKEMGNPEKAGVAYTKWLEIRRQAVDQNRHASEYQQLAEEMLQKNIMPETALEFAKTATQIRTDRKYVLTLGHAYLANAEYEAALEQFMRGLNLINQSRITFVQIEELLLSPISEAGNRADDKTPYAEIAGKLLDAVSEKLDNQSEHLLALAKFSLDHGLTEKAATFIYKAGFIPEDAWLTLGPFDNTEGTGYKTAHIPEQATQVDVSATYDGADGQVTWKKLDDTTFDGFVDFGKDVNWRTAYAWVKISSPDEREAQLRFDSDDQGIVWLNDKRMYAHRRRNRGAVMDRRTIPVTLRSGENSILVKVCNETSNWGFYLRITDTEGKPFDDLKIGNLKDE